MDKINVSRVTLADADADGTGVPIPNIVPSSAETLRLVAHVPNLPSNVRRVRMVVNIFQPSGRPTTGGWFNARVLYVGPLDETFDINSPPPHRFALCIPHPDHLVPLDKRRWGHFRKAISARLLTTFLAPLLWVLFSYRWHNGPGPYDTEVTLTAADERGTTIEGTEATYQYPFISV